MLKKWVWAGLATLLILAACTTGPQSPGIGQASGILKVTQPPLPLTTQEETAQLVVPSIEAPFLPTTVPGQPIPSPTPDKARKLPPMRLKAETYVVESGDSLAKIAQGKGVSLADVIKANDIQNPDLLEVGQVLTIPPPIPKPTGPGFKILPDSELVDGPTSGYFDVAAYLQGTRGYLSRYSEEVDGETTSAAEIVKRVSGEYSVNPRLLLALIEYRSGWLTQSNPPVDMLKYPAGWVDPARTGLYRQLAWAANNLNRGFYLWRVNGLSYWILPDSSYVPLDPTINAGTAGVQNLLGLYFGYQDWLKAVSAQGFVQTYTTLFGNPFEFAVEPLLPAGLKQPAFQLPFEAGQVWSFTGGPHGGWGDGSAWAALDFAPPGEALGCVQNDAWVTAVADGVIVISEHGQVVEDLDGDGKEQTGWTILYMHIETRERVKSGTEVKIGDRIGHPSCEGGVSSGTHTHLARRYNGEWIPADGDIPFNLSGWISAGYGSEYDGELRLNGQTVEAWAGRGPGNQISR